MFHKMANQIGKKVGPGGGGPPTPAGRCKRAQQHIGQLAEIPHVLNHGQPPRCQPPLVRWTLEIRKEKQATSSLTKLRMNAAR